MVSFLRIFLYILEKLVKVDNLPILDFRVSKMASLPPKTKSQQLKSF